MTLPPDPFSGRLLVILNPVAGQDDPARVRRQIGGALAVRGAPFDLVETSGAGDAERLAKEAVALGYHSVVAAGGDGTIAEVITGLAGGPLPLGIIPLGTGNQLAANLGIPSDIERAVEVAVSGYPRPIDIGQLGSGRYFALMAGAGWDAEVMGSCSRELKDRWGFGAYLFQGLKRVTAPPSALFRIAADGAQFQIRAATVLIANAGVLFSSIFPMEVQIAPDASFEDGLLDVCIYAPRSLPDVATVLWKVARRQYRGDDRMIYLQAREVIIDADPPIITQVDGDCVGETPLRARAVPGGVRVLSPAIAV
ncbi:MAG TPA: diacylglycerol kinase family protein [Longimicrobiaceae bacterium]